MSAVPKSFAVKQDPKETKSKQYSDGAFSNLADDGLLTGPSVKTATQTEDSVLLSDDENKTLTTLEPAKKPARDVAEGMASKPDAQKTTNPGQPNRSLKKSFVTQDDIIKTLKEQAQPSKPVEVPTKEKLLQKMRNRLSKQIEIKSIGAVTPTTPTAPLDTSGAIEIPHDLILGSEIPPTPVSSIETKENKLEDDDLIAILEGNDVEIRENATEIELCVGGNSTEEGVEEMEILILNHVEVEQARIDREKEIARRQIENLPKFPGRRTKSVAKLDKPLLNAKHSGPKAAHPLPTVEEKPISSPPAAKVPMGLTIKGQTTIRPIPRKSTAEQQAAPQTELLPKQPKSETDQVKASSVKNPRVTAKVSKESRPALVASPVSPQTLSKSTDLVDSLVSDWDDEPVLSQTVAEGPGKTNAIESETKRVVSQLPVAAEVSGDAKFIASMLPPSAEPRRVIKKKIIWDPSVATVPFATLVKSNRGTLPTFQTEPTGGAVLITASEKAALPLVRRKRADSVAVRMFDDKPRQIVRKRAQTPELAQLVASDRVAVEPSLENNNSTTSPVIDAKAKKRKRNEIERLLADEGAINMLYDVECEANQKDLLKNTAVDTNDEDEKLLAKTKIITDAVINQGRSPTEGASQQGPRVRAKRATTPLNQPGTPISAELNSSKPETTQKGTVTTTMSQSGAAKKSNSNGPANAPSTGARKRKTTATLKDWDYVYNAQGGDDAMIIRRRSNSSYSSSCTSPRRLSIDQSYETQTGAPKTVNQPPSDDEFTFAKPPDKRSRLPPARKPDTRAVPDKAKVDSSLLANMRGKLTKALKTIKGDPSAPNAKKNLSPSNPTNKSPTTTKMPQGRRKMVKLPESSDVVNYEGSVDGELVSVSDQTTVLRFDDLQQIACNRDGDCMEIVLKTHGDVATGGATMSDVFSFEAMQELINVLTILEKEPLVKAVLVMSSGQHFSRGLDVGHLIQPVPKRKLVAEEMSEALKTFLRTLVSFSKPIIAAVHGDVLGMGVTILPAFDIVLAQNGSTFMAPYGYFGYLPEGMKAFTNCRTLKSKVISDLFLQGKRLSAPVAQDYGLVTESIPADRFHERARSLVKKAASQSAQAMQSIKINLRRDFVGRLDFVLTLEQKNHIQQWTSAECQQKFKQFVSKGGELGKFF